MHGDDLRGYPALDYAKGSANVSPTDLRAMVSFLVPNSI